ncbi:zinc finger CCHC domain-containing protein 14, partial [Gadus chalcogrammus]|uniref:zinc finger CCHC domain-containing protein 14 n=1 Tax=Gadus chalcogrammus TaxID=1042646 RepID=UPI0024C495E8
SSSASLLTVGVERVAVRGFTSPTDDHHGEHVFEAHWLDGCVSSVVRTRQEVTELLSQLADAFPEEGLDKLSLPPLEPDPRVGESAAVPRSQQGHPPLAPTTGAQFLSLSHCLPAAPAAPPAPSSQGPAPEPNGILDWLRRLRLHKYYPVFKQLSMDEFLALTEEDLNKYDLTQGAKKKLKTQLELQNREMKLEKRYGAPQFLGSCGGIAMVTPSSHMRPSSHPASTGELRVDVETGAHHQGIPVSRDGSSSSGYSSSLGSPRSPLRRSTAFDRTKDVHRPLGGPEQERACLLLLGSSAGRPTAQVLPVQTDPPPPLPAPPPLASLHPPHPGYPHHHPLLALTSPRKLRPLPMGPDDRTKAGLAPPGPGGGPGPGGLRLDALQDPGGCRGLMGGGAVGLMMDTSSALAPAASSLQHASHGPPVHFHLSSAPAPAAYYSYPAAPGSYCSAPAVTASPSPSPPSSASSSSSCSSSLDGPPPGGANNGVGHHPPPSACPCSACGCHGGGCGAFGALPGYAAAAGYLRPFPAAAGGAGPSLFALGPVLHFSPLLPSPSSSSSSSSPSPGSAPGGGPFTYPLVAPQALYRHGLLSHDLHPPPPLQHGCGGGGGGGGAYTAPETQRNGAPKRPAGGLSCYNCGVGGHRAEDCRQPPMDAQQGTFRLKYIPRPDIQESGE